MDYKEAREWLAGNCSMANIVPREPFETWHERIARADAAMMEQAYWVHRAHDQDQKPPPRTVYFTCHHEPWQLEVYAYNPRPAAEGGESMTITEGCMVRLACGWVVGPLEPCTKTDKIDNVAAWRADNYTCGYGFSWTRGGKHVGNPDRINHPLHIVSVVAQEEEEK